MIAYAVCTTPRTGGKRLDAALTEYGFGKPDEYLHPDKVRELVAEWDIDHRDYLPELWQRRSANDCFGVRFHWTHLFDSQQANDWRDALPTKGKYILLTRDDREAQARSIYTAYQNDDWMTPYQPHVKIPERELVFWSERFAIWNAEWLYWFERHRIHHLHVTYEQYSNAPGATVDEILAYISV